MEDAGWRRILKAGGGRTGHPGFLFLRIPATASRTLQEHSQVHLASGTFSPRREALCYLSHSSHVTQKDGARLTAFRAAPHAFYP
jgi:hypothetical protein